MVPNHATHHISKTGKYMAGALIRLGLAQVYQNWSGSLKVSKVKLGLRNKNNVLLTCCNSQWTQYWQFRNC